MAPSVPAPWVGPAVGPTGVEIGSAGSEYLTAFFAGAVLHAFVCVNSTLAPSSYPVLHRGS